MNRLCIFHAADLDLKICEMELGRHQADYPDLVTTSDA